MAVAWCSVNCEPGDGVQAAAHIFDSNSSANGSNSTNLCHYPFCVRSLVYTISNSNARVYDLILVIFNVLFLLLLLISLAPTVKKLYRSFALFKILYFMVFVIPVVTVIHGTISMTLGYSNTAAKVTQVMVRGAILMTELSVVIFGLFFKSYADQVVKLCFTVFTIILVAVVFTVAEGLSELLRVDQLACSHLDLFTHGGMIFLFTTSVLFATIYLLIFLLYILGLYKRWNFPSKKSFYRYALILCVVNIAQAIGSMLWYTGKYRKETGHAGICITTITTFVYLTTFAPVVYWIFLKNYFRMNKPAAVQGSSGTINVSSEEARKRATSMRFSKPIMAKRSSYFEEQANMIEDEGESSVSSYGSLLKDEEIFSKLVKR